MIQRWRARRGGAPADVRVPAFQEMARTPMLLRAVTWLLTVVVTLTAVADYLGLDSIRGASQGNEEALNLAGRQRQLSQRMVHQGLQLAQDFDARDRWSAALSQTLHELRQDRKRLEQLPFFQIEMVGKPSIAALELGATRVLASRDAGEARRATAALAESAEAFLPAMDAAVREAQRRAEAIAREVQTAHFRQMAALALFVSVLSLGLGEWLARRIARQNQRSHLMVQELERLALVAERTYNAVIITDRLGRVRWTNDAFTRITGYSLADVLGRKPGAVLQFEGTDPETRRRIGAALAAEQPIQVEILNRGKEGRTYWLMLDIQPIRDGGGQCVGFSAVETDITLQVLERQRLEALLGTSPAGVLQQDSNGRVTHANPEACRILGLSLEELMGLEAVESYWQTIREDGSRFPVAELPGLVALRTAQPQRGVVTGIVTHLGHTRWLRINAEPLKNPKGEVHAVVSSFVDITEAHSQRRLLTLTVQAAGLGTWDWWLKSGEVQFNDRWWEMLGYRRGDLPETSTTWELLVHPDDVGASQAALQLHLMDPAQPYRSEFRMRRADGGWSWIMAAGAVIERLPDKTPLRMAGVHIDINGRKALEQRLAVAALTDALTGLPNRAALTARLAKCASRAQRDPSYRFAVLFMDFDRFKQVNDTLGHEAGDELLRQIADRLRTTLRPSDDVARLETPEPPAIRLGGDEFVVLLEPVVHLRDVEAVAHRLLNALAQPYAVAGRTIESTVSIGVAHSSPGSADPDTMLHDADSAMYEAKRRGRGQFVVHGAG